MRDVIRDSDDGGGFGIGPKTHIFDLFADGVLRRKEALGERFADDDYRLAIGPIVCVEISAS